jgi:translation initiation factor IF-2
MLESETSGAPTGSAETAPPPAAFGARGSGLARGKRPAAPAPATTTASNGEYRPTSIEVVAAKSEYKNPFAETAPAAVVDEVKPIPAAESPAPTASVETKPIQPAFTAPIQPVASTPVEPAAKAQLNILPTEEPKRTELSWEAGSSDTSAKTNARPRREDRPIFRAERPEKNPFEPREPRDSREPRRESAFEPRRNLPFEPREPRH